ncbi:MAG: hypothetical protein ACO26G_01055 [Rickettsiales bacterium]
MPQKSYFLISANDIAKNNTQLILEQNIILQKLFPHKNPEDLRSKLSQILIDDFKEENPILVAKFLLEQIDSDFIKRFSDESSFIDEFKFQYLQNQRLIQKDLEDYQIASTAPSSQNFFKEVALESIGELTEDARNIFKTTIEDFRSKGQNIPLSTSSLSVLLGLAFMTKSISAQSDSLILRDSTLPRNATLGAKSSAPTTSNLLTPAPKFEYKKYVENLNSKISTIRQELLTKNHGELPEFTEVMTRLKSSNAELFDESGKLIANSNSIFGEFYEGLDLSKMKIKYEDFKFFNNNNVKFKDVNFSGSEIGNETPPTSINIGVNILSGNLSNCVFKNFPRLAIGEDIFYKYNIAMDRNANSGIDKIDKSGNIESSSITNHEL